MTNQHAKKLSELAAKGRKKIDPAKRSEIARHAAEARWKDHKKHPLSD